MKIVVAIILSGLMLSCTGSTNKDALSTEQDYTERILIGTVATETSLAKFFEVRDARIVEKYLDLFLDTVENSFSSHDYDHRIQFFDGDQIIEEIFVKSSGNMHSFWGSEKITDGIVNNGYWDSLVPYMNPLEYENYIVPNREIAEEFYELAQSKNAFVSAPYFCNWLEYDGELYLRTNTGGGPITTDSLRSVIAENYPNDEVKISPIDFVIEFSTPREHERFKLTCSYAFFKKFKFRGRDFVEIESQKFQRNGSEYLYRGNSVPFDLRSPILSYRRFPTILSLPEDEKTSSKPPEYFVKFAPIIEFVGSQEAKEELEKWLEKRLQ